MRKSLLTLMLAGGIAASATAADVTFSYAYQPDNSFGSQKKETCDVAIFLPGETFGGYKIKAIEGPLNTSSGYKDGAVWLSSELKLDGKKNDPDMGYWQCPVSTTAVSYTLPSAVTVPETGVFVGFSFAIDKLDNNSKYPVMISTTGGDANTLYFHGSKSNPSSWDNYGESNGYAAAIKVTLEVDDMKANNVTVGTLPATVFMSLDTPESFTAKLLNTSTNDVNSVDYEYTLGGKTYSQHADLETPAVAGMAVPFNVTVDIPAQSTTIGEDVVFTVTKVNGVANVASNPSGTFYVKVVTEMPVRQTLIEEYTNLGCQWCTRGFAALEYLKKNYPEFVTVSIHNTWFGADAMAVINPNDYPVPVTGDPAVSLDRIYVGDPYAGCESLPVSDTKLPIVGQVEALNSQFTAWGIKATAEISEDNVVSVTSQVFNIGKVTNNRYKLAYMLVSDGLTSPTWSQKNAYSSYSQSSANIDELNNFCKGGIYGTSSVKGLVFDDVVISADGYLGVEGSMPSDLDPETLYDHTYTWDVSDNKLVQDPNNLYVVAVILNEIGQSVNCVKVHVENTGAVGEIDTDADAPVEYYNLNGVRVANPEKGIYIKKQGSKTSKVAL